MAPINLAADALHAEKHRWPGENFEQAMDRVANATSDDFVHLIELMPILRGRRFLPGGRIQLAVGSGKNVTGLNCYVSGTIADSMVDGDGSIMQRVMEAAATMRMGGGIGYDFSPLRPEHALIKKLGAASSGPLSFMEIFNATCKAIASAGKRRGAQMGIMRVDHPDIEKFIESKNNKTALTNFNLSVAITDEFMVAVQNDLSFDLRFEDKVYKTISAKALWDKLMRSTYDYAEPGVVFIDTINRMNNLWYCETIAATNPCAEQPLPPHGACLLGSFNLTQYVASRVFDYERFTADIWHVVRMMDNVIDETIYPLPAQKAEALSKRRMGLGYTGLANAIEYCLGRPSYGDPDFLAMQEKITRTLCNEAYMASIDLAKEKGAFPLYDDRYLEGNFIRGLPEDIQEGIAAHGIRNSHLTSIAPTGSISMGAGNVSSGCEPVFSYEQTRLVNGEPVDLNDYGVTYLGIKGRRTADVTIDQHLAVLGATVPYIDSAVSKTCNVPTDIAFEDFEHVYMRAWEMGVKGCTTFRLGGKREGILESKDSQVCVINADGSRSCD